MTLISKDFLEFAETLQESWNQISFFIKKAEELLNMSEENDTPVWVEEEICIQWDSQKKRLMGCVNGFKKPLMEHKIRVREKAFPHLKNFIYKRFGFKDDG